MSTTVPGKRALALVLLITALVIVSVLGMSCGEKEAAVDDTRVAPGDQDAGEIIDDAVNEMNTEMDSVSPNDFDDTQLSDEALGL